MLFPINGIHVFERSVKGFKIRFLRECRFRSDLGHQISEESLNRKIEAFFLPHHYSNFLKFAFHLVINQRKAGLSPPCYIYSHVIAHHIQPLVHILSLRVIFCTCHLLTLLRLSGTAEKLAVYYVSISGWWVS